jgi:hypothetical protein
LPAALAALRGKFEIVTEGISASTRRDAAAAAADVPTSLSPPALSRKYSPLPLSLVEADRRDRTINRQFCRKKLAFPRLELSLCGVPEEDVAAVHTALLRLIFCSSGYCCVCMSCVCRVCVVCRVCCLSGDLPPVGQTGRLLRVLHGAGRRGVPDRRLGLATPIQLPRRGIAGAVGHHQGRRRPAGLRRGGHRYDHTQSPAQA